VRAPDLFTEEQRNAIQHAVHEAELLTSGEIRVFIDDHCKDADVLNRAATVFEKLNMHQTALRNGVLLYLSVEDRKFAIIGDIGIHEKVKDDFWNEAKTEMLSHFKNNKVTEGLIAGIIKAGKALGVYFPRAHDDTNELPNDIVFGEE
jgi:uncharacterized membrane protein